ncbi:hypothetical protein B296_00015502 [Ensete ventricosum]|uniref:Uncharacterized protein n=1 Tax=Ensete ventricosum TaxID=4639 RepID=A0A427B583_ENSVE|nr:hypothetical protein B296_00015502 [Ensete ventricosum]
MNAWITRVGCALGTPRISAIKHATNWSARLGSTRVSKFVHVGPNGRGARMKSMGYAPELDSGRHRLSWSSSRVDRKFLHKGLVEVGCPMWPFDAQVSAPAKVELE